MARRFDYEISIPFATRVLSSMWTALVPRVIDQLVNIAPHMERCLWDLAELAFGPKRKNASIHAA